MFDYQTDLTFLNYLVSKFWAYVSGVPKGKMKVRRGWVGEGVSPSHTLEKKSKYELNAGFSCIFWT